jgi:hypothetical protein
MYVTALHGIAVSFWQEHAEDTIVFIFDKCLNYTRIMTCFYTFSLQDAITGVMAQGRFAHGKSRKGLLNRLVE